MKKLINAIAVGATAIIGTANPAIAGNVRIVDNGAPHCLNATQVIAVAQWLTAVTPGWARVDLMVIGDNPQFDRANRRANNALYYEYWEEYLDRFQYIFSQRRIPFALTCVEGKDYVLEENEPGNAPEMSWLNNTNQLSFKGIPIAGTNAYLSVPTRFQVITAKDVLNIF